MAKKMFVNLPVTDLSASTAFYEAIGMTRDPGFSNAVAAAMILTDTISIGLVTHDFYRTLTNKAIADTHATSAVLLALGLDSRAEVDAITEAAVAAGGTSLHDAEDEGFMYSRAFADPDGHGFGPFWMNADAMLAAMPQQDA